MLSLLSVLLAFGQLLPMTTLQSEPEWLMSSARAHANSMAVHHMAAYETARTAGFPVGEIAASSPDPFQSRIAWTSQVITDGLQKLLVTAPLEFNPTEGMNWNLTAAATFARSLKPGETSAEITASGRYTTEGGNHFIGELAIPRPLRAIIQGTPAMATQVQ
ncbi:MAG: hypothetical protein OXC53_04580 [Rhodobacteraceae bacterium]|nr:hypothetical protein [Paracoccaceae bacterium]